MMRTLWIVVLAIMFLLGNGKSAGALFARPDGGGTVANIIVIDPHKQLCEQRQRANQTDLRWTLLAMKADFAAYLPQVLKAEALIALAFFASAFALGALVRTFGWNANYTRKLLGAVLLVVPFIVAKAVSYTAKPVHVLASMAIFFVCLLMLSEPFRRRLRFLDVAFSAIDRPEDRPHTLTWFVSSYVASSFLLLVLFWWAVPEFPRLGIVVLASVSIGDLLAGVVGYRFGRHRYVTSALWTQNTYTRSLEGSACVFLTTLVVLFFVRDWLMPASLYWYAVITLPLAMTLAEAWSPHTWDEPVMLAVAIAVLLTLLKVWTFTACA